MAKKVVPANIMLDAIKSSGGVVVVILKKLEKAGYKLTRRQLYDRLQEYPSYKEALEEERQAVVDKAEANLIQAISEGDIKVSIEFLKKQARDRGWGDESSINVKGLENLKIQVKFIDKKDVKRDKGT